MAIDLKKNMSRPARKSIFPAKKNRDARRGQEAQQKVREILLLEAKLRPILRRVWSAGSDKDVSWMAADIAGLWEVSREHISLVKKLTRMGRSFDRDKLRDLMIECDINWKVNAPAHVQTLKGKLDRFMRSLAEEDRPAGRKGRARSARGRARQP
jgi:hypothetical protein